MSKIIRYTSYDGYRVGVKGGCAIMVDEISEIRPSSSDGTCVIYKKDKSIVQCAESVDTIVSLINFANEERNNAST